MICPNCGANLPDTAKMCHVCRTVFQSEGRTDDLQGPAPTTTKAPQQVEVTKVSVKVSKKVKILIVLAILLIIGGVAGFFIVRNILDNKSQQEYMDNMTTASSKMLAGAAKAESTGGMIHDVWYNTIHEVDDKKTDKYTKSGKKFNDDFNTSLALYMISDEYTKASKEIKDNQNEVQNLMKELINPPEKYKEAYNALKNYYDAYLKLTNCAINPTGNLSSYTSEFNNADTATLNCYNAMKMYLE